MKKLLTAFAAISALAVATATAGEVTRSTGKTYTPTPMEPETKGGLYVAIFGGVNVAQTGDVDDEEDDVGLLGDVSADINSDVGWFAGLKFGYVFPCESVVKPVLEIEGFYNGVNADFDVDTDLGDFNVNADFHSAVFMVNAMAKFDLGKFQPYIGAGIGYAHTWIDQVEVDDVEVDDVGEDEGTLAYQGIAGLEYHVTDKIGIFTEYKALVFDEVGDVDTYINHLVGIGVRFGF